MGGCGMGIGGFIGLGIGIWIVRFMEGTSTSYQARGVPLFGPIWATITSERSIGCLKSIIIPLVARLKSLST